MLSPHTAISATATRFSAARVHGGGDTDQITNPGPATASSGMHRSPGEELPQHGGEDAPGHVVFLAFEGAVPWVGKCGGERLCRVGCPASGAVEWQAAMAAWTWHGPGRPRRSAASSSFAPS